MSLFPKKKWNIPFKFIESLWNLLE